MFYIAVIVFPIIAVCCGIASLYSMVRFVAQIQQEIREGK